MKVLSCSSPEIFIDSYRFMMFHGLHLRPYDPSSPARHCAKIAWASRVLPGPNLWDAVSLESKSSVLKNTQLHYGKWSNMTIRKAEVGKVCQCYWPCMALRLNKMTLHSNPSSPPNTPSLTNHIIHAYPCHATLVWQVSLSSKLDLHFPTTTSKKWQNKKRHFGSVHCWVWPRTAEDPANTWNSFKTMFKSIAGWFESGQFCCFLLLC